MLMTMGFLATIPLDVPSMRSVISGVISVEEHAQGRQAVLHSLSDR